MTKKPSGRRQYRNPPIDEAVCAFYLTSGTKSDLTGRFYKKIAESYPGEPRPQTPMEALLGSGLDKSLFTLRQGPTKMQFSTGDEKALVAVGPGTLSVHVLRPYPGWNESFRPRIQEACKAYDEISDSVRVNKLGLRYINRIEFPQEQVPLEEFFNFPFKSPSGFPTHLREFLNRLEYSYEDQPIKLILTFASAVVPERRSAFILDLDLSWELENALPLSNVLNNVDEMRQRERVAFESLITDAARKVFNAE